MKKLYEEIMALEQNNAGYDDYGTGFDDAKEAAAELVKKHELNSIIEKSLNELGYEKIK